MMKKCNYFRIVASVLFMLLGTMNTWAATVYTNLDRSFFKQWDGIGAKASVVSTFSDNRYYNVGNVQLYNGGTIYGDGNVDIKHYADLSEYEGIRIKVTGKSRNVRFIFNRRNANGSDNGLVEYQKLVSSNTTVEVRFSEIFPDGALYYHLNAIKFAYDYNQDQASSSVPELQLFKSDGYVSPCGNGVLSWTNGYKTLNGTASGGKVTTYNNILTYTWTTETSNLLSVTGKNQNLSLYDNIILRTDDLSQGAVYRILIEAQVGGQTKKYYYLMSASGLMSIPLSADKGEGWYDQDGYQETKMDPSLLTNVQIFFGGASTSGNVKFYKLAYAKSVRNIDYDENHCLVLTLGDLRRESLNSQGDFVWDNGLKKQKAETAWLETAFAYPVQSPKTFRINGTDNMMGRPNYQFVENVILTNRTTMQKLWTDLQPIYGTNINTTIGEMSGFQIKIAGTGTLQYSWIAFSDGQAHLVSFDSDGGTPCYSMECVAGVNLPETTKSGYQFAGWYDEDHCAGNAGDIYHTDRDVTLKAKWIKSGLFNPAQDRVFFLDFENLSQDDLLSGDNAPEGAFADGVVTRPLYYNYGNRGKLMKHPTFGQYYQNLADADEFTESKSQNFLRVVLTDEQKNLLNNICFEKGSDGLPNLARPKNAQDRSATVGFWVNGKIAVDYELPLERGSMFCILSNERTLKADDALVPRYMFDVSCNGWVYSYMPKSESREYMNRFSYGETTPVVTNGNPLPSLFGASNYENTQNQLKHMFYNDKDWHYVTYVATNDLKKITMYLDGVKTGELDTETDKNCDHEYDANGDYAGRVYFLRNLVLGGFTPHGLFYGKQYYSDAALAYDDIAIYSRALTADEIRDIIAEKNFNTSEWLLYQDPSTEDRCFQAKNNEELLNYPQAAGIKFKFANNQVVFHANKKLLEMKPGVEYTVTNVPRGYYVRYVSQFDGEQTAGNPPHWPANFELQGNRTSEVPGEEKFSVTSLRAMGAEYDDYTLVVQDNIWTRAIYVTPYRYANMKYVDSDKRPMSVVELTPSTLSNYANKLPQLSLKIDSDWETTLNNIPDGGTIKYTSSAPQIASVAADGKVTVHGLEGYATITAELVSDNIFDDINGHVDGIKTSYEIRVLKENDTYKLASKPEVGDRLATKVDNDYITVTAGGWEYNGGRYQTGVDSKTKNAIYDTDEWQDAVIESRANDANPIDGFEKASQGKLNAMSETYGLGGDWSTGRFDPATTAAPGHNVKPWTLPTRGSYVKIQPKKAGVLSMYILQNGNLGDQVVENQGQPNEKKWCKSVSWRPVYVADESGKIINDVIVTSTGNISPYDNFFREGRRRAQFIYEEQDTWNQKLKASMQNMDRERLEYLISYWNNANWKQKIIPSGDGGYMVMSKAMMRYTFNVLPGKTYYIFSNVSKIGISGYNFEEGKLLNNSTIGLRSAANASVQFEDVKAENPADYTHPSNADCVDVTYNRTFTPGKWGSICLPFSMNNKQMKENFGDETSVVLLKGIDEKGVVQMVWHVNQDIIAGYPYFILPRGKESITQIKTNAYFDPTVKAPSFVIGPEMDNGQSATYGSIELLEKAVGKTEYPYVFKGNFDTEQATAGSYVMTTSGVLTKASNTPNIKPFRAYLRYCSQIDASSGDHANGKPLTGMGYMNSDGEEVTTSIEQILESNGIFVDSANVYGIDGQVKRYNTHDLNGLPKGIYIVNGKKYVVK